ncbi:MAG: hypothetical protein ABI840_10780 [bacterium]
MNPSVENVIPNKDYALTLCFSNVEIKIFDVMPYNVSDLWDEIWINN